MPVIPDPLASGDHSFPGRADFAGNRPRPAPPCSGASITCQCWRRRCLRWARSARGRRSRRASPTAVWWKTRRHKSPPCWMNTNSGPNAPWHWPRWRRWRRRYRRLVPLPASRACDGRCRGADCRDGQLRTLSNGASRRRAGVSSWNRGEASPLRPRPPPTPDAASRRTDGTRLAPDLSQSSC